MIENLLVVALCFLVLSILAAVYRLIKGPSIPDRVQALDNIGVNIIAAIAIISIFMRTSAFFSVMLLLGILSFIGTIAFARFLERGKVIESNRHE